MPRRSSRKVTHSLGATDDPQDVFKPGRSTRIVLLVVAAGLLVLAIMVVIALTILG